MSTRGRITRPTKAGFSIKFESGNIRNCDFSILHNNQSLMPEPRKGAGDYVSYRTDAAGDFVVGEVQVKYHWTVYGNDGRLRLRKKEECKSLSNLVERQCLNQFCMLPDLARHQAERCQREGWIFHAQPSRIVFFNKENVRIHF